MKGIAYTLLATTLIGGASAAVKGVQYQRIAMDDGKLCVDSRLTTKQMKMEGIFGSDLRSSVRGVFVSYPMAEKSVLTVFVRPAGKDERPLPPIEEDQLQPVKEIVGLSATPIDNHKGQRFVATEDSAVAGRFTAVCRDLPIPRQCSRPFRHSGLVGTYSFKREQLPDWKNLEAALGEALSSKEIANCDEIR